MSFLRVYKHSNDFREFSLSQRRLANKFTSQVSFTICNPFFEDTLALFQFQSVSAFLFFFFCLDAPPPLSWVNWRLVSTCISSRRSTKSQSGWTFPPDFSNVHVRIRARCLFFPSSPVCSENGSHPCSPLESCRSVVPGINPIVHDPCDFPRVRTWTWTCQ